MLDLADVDGDPGVELIGEGVTANPFPPLSPLAALLVDANGDAIPTELMATEAESPVSTVSLLGYSLGLSGVKRADFGRLLGASCEDRMFLLACLSFRRVDCRDEKLLLISDSVSDRESAPESEPNEEYEDEDEDEDEDDDDDDDDEP